MKPPRAAEWLLRAAAAGDERDDVAADLAEEASARAVRDGASPARRWYRRQVLRSVLPLLARRLSLGRTVVRFGPPLAGLRQDLRVVARSLSAAPVFTLSVTLLLGIGIGTHTIVYAIVDGIALRPLPFGDRADRLFTLHSTHPTVAQQDWDDAKVSYPDLLDLRREATSIEGLEGLIVRNISVSNESPGAGTERMLAASITPGLFGLLGVTPARGRDFVDEDGAAPGFESVAILSHAAWRDWLGSDPGVIGRSLTINGRALTVIGVMPPEFSFPEGQRLWLPFREDPVERRAYRGILAVGLLRPNITLDRGADELRAVAGRLAVRYPGTNRDWSVHAIPLRAFFVSAAEVTLLLAAVSVLLLVACANVAGLIVARGLWRLRELSLRAALGASRLRLVRLLLSEAAVLAAIGGALGLALASWGIRAFVAWNPEPPPYWALPVLDWRVAMFGLGLTALVALMTGLVPAIRISRLDGSGVVQAASRWAGGTAAHHRLQRTLVAGQVAASFALIVGALLLGRSATALLHADGGFAVDPLLSLRFYVAGDRYDPIEARAAVVEEIVRRVSVIPGVRAVTATGSIPTDDGGADIRLLEPDGMAPEPREIGAQAVPVTSTFWDALALTLIEGRTFTAGESRDPRTDAIIVNRRLASRFWPGQSALNRTIRIQDGREAVTGRVVGVAPDLVYEEFSEETPQSQLNVYVPYVRAGWRTPSLLVSAPPNPGALARAVRDAIRGVDPGLAVFDVMTMADRRAFNHWAARLVGRTFSAFAMTALLLAVIGAYGIAAYAVARRTREIGVRLAIGATRRDVVRLFVGSGARVALIGVLAGGPLALGVALALRSTLFRVSPWTVELWIGPPILLSLAVLIAYFLPARRASRTDPTVALRAE